MKIEYLYLIIMGEMYIPLGDRARLSQSNNIGILQLYRNGQLIGA